MNSLPRVVTCLVLAVLPAVAADPIYGVWRMRADDKNPGLKSQVFTVEPSDGGAKFSYDIEMTRTHIKYSFVTKLDGALVPAMSDGTEIMKVWVKKITDFEFDSGTVVRGTETKFKNKISSDGKTFSSDGAITANGESMESHVVFERVK